MNSQRPAGLTEKQKHYVEFGEFRVDLLTHRLLRNSEASA